MKKNFFVFIVSVFSSLIIISCSKSTGTGGGTSGTNGTGTATPGPLFLAVRTVVQSNCAVSGCHTGAGAQNGINFSDDNTIVAQKARIKLRAVDQAGTINQMPPPPQSPLSVADRQKISDWINAGGAITN